MNKNTKQLVPKLRFPEFRDSAAWEEMPLGNYIEELREKSTVQDEHEVLTSSRNGLIRQRDYYDNNERIADRDNIGFNIIPPNYLTYRSRSDDRRFFFNENNLGITGIISSYYPVFRLVNSTNKFFVELLSVHSNTIGKRSVGTSQTVLSLNELKRIHLPFPKIAEQQKIADCLSSIDDLITAQSQKVEALKTHKKGLIQQLFPREGETVPRLRFPEFREDLETISFSELGDIKIGLTHKPEYLKSGVPFLSSKNISGGYIDFENINYISEEKFLSMPESTKPKVGDILFTRVGSNLGNPIILEDDREFGIFVSLGIFRSNKKAFNYYIKHWMDSDYFWKQLRQKVAGGAKDNLNSNWLREFTLAIPTIPEQRKIADCLSSIDDLITAKIQKLESLKTHKKGLMQQLFTIATEVEA